MFGRKTSLEDLLKAISELSDADKAKVKALFDETPEEEPKAEAETQEAESQDVSVTPQEAPEEAEAPQEETGETEETAPEEVTEEVVAEEAEQTEEVASADTVEEAPVVPDENTQENMAELLKGLTDRVAEMESKFATIDALIQEMEAFKKRRSNDFGYSASSATTGRKSLQDMSIEELEALARGQG